MIRTNTLGAAFVALALLAGCDKSPAEAQNDAREAQRRADQESARMQRRADEFAQQAQAKANEEAQRAEQTFVKARNDFRTKIEGELNDLSAQIDDLKVRASKATGRSKLELDAAVKSLEDQRFALKRDLNTLERTSAQDFEGLKARLNAALAAMKKSLNDASLRI